MKKNTTFDESSKVVFYIRKYRRKAKIKIFADPC